MSSNGILSIRGSDPPAAVTKSITKPRERWVWIMVNNPDDFKNFGKTVRSHVMWNFRNEDKVDSAAASPGVQTDTVGTPPQGPAALPMEVSSWSESYNTPISLNSNFEEPHHGELTAQPSTLGLHSSTASFFGSYLIPASRVTGYGNTEAHENIMFRILVDKIAQYRQIEHGVDASTVLPAFEHPDLNSVKLIRLFVRTFATESAIEYLVSAMVWHPRLLLSVTYVACTWADMQDFCSDDNPVTTTVKDEIVAMVNERLENDDVTLLAILHLLAGDMRSCNEEILRIHKEGVVKIISERGGMQALSNSKVAEVAAAFSYHCDIFCEIEQAKIFQVWTPRNNLRTVTITLPESPLFCHRGDHKNLFQYDGCSQVTQAILRSMRDLTELFLAIPGAQANADGVKVEDDERGSRCLLEYRHKANDIFTYLVSLPSATNPGHVSSQDWVYEACRIAALIYTIAIIERVPFSVAVRSSIFSNISGSGSVANSAATHQSLAISPVEALFEALKRTDVSNVWRDMAGVLYWVCAVGAAAARTPTALDPVHQSQQVWVRQCLVMHGARTLIILLFQHPMPIIMAQQQLLRVQEVLASQDSGW